MDLREDPKTNGTSFIKYKKNFTIKLSLVYSVKFVTSYLENACQFSRAKLSMKPALDSSINIEDEAVFCGGILQNHRQENYLRRSIAFSPSM